MAWSFRSGSPFGCSCLPRRRHSCIYSHLHGNGGFDRWMRVVADEIEIFELEIIDVFDARVQPHAWQRSAITRKLFMRLIEMISIQMQIAECVDKFARS